MVFLNRSAVKTDPFQYQNICAIIALGLPLLSFFLSLSTAHFSLLSAYCFLPSAYCLLPTAFCFLLMLTSLPPLSPQTRPLLPGSPPLPQHLKRTACPERKRGGQPGNSNAFRHGLYSSHAPHPHAALFRSPPEPLDSSAIFPAVKRDWIAALTRIVVENRLKLGEVVAITAGGLHFTEMCTWLRLATCIIGTHLKVVKALHELGGRQEHLRSLVRDLPALLHWEFGRRGIPAQPVFVPQELNNLHANLGWESQRLTDAQWLLLQETFLSLHVGLDSSRKYRRRKPLPADRLLFEGILWKLAGGLRWQDLPDNYPVRLCQDLYSALYRTGHMQAIYKQLHWHLNVYGEATLDELVERGCFVITGNRVQLSPSEDLIWEKYTALLLLQQAFRARRAIQREADLERRRRGIFYRLPSPRLPGFPRRRIDGGAPKPGPVAYGSETVCQIKPPPHLEANLLERKIPWLALYSRTSVFPKRAQGFVALSPCYNPMRIDSETFPVIDAGGHFCPSPCFRSNSISPQMK